MNTREVAAAANFRVLLAGVDDARTFPLGQIRRAVPLLRRAHRHRNDPELQERIANIRALAHQCEIASLPEAA